jgi:hypothetical protein
MTTMLLDSELRFTDQTSRSSYSYVAVYRTGPYTVRVRLRSATTRRESQAVAEVLAAGLTWTVLVDAEPPERTRGEVDPASVAALADGLLARATVILANGHGDPR